MKNIIYPIFQMIITIEFDNSMTKNYIMKLNKNILYYTEKSLIRIDNVNRI